MSDSADVPSDPRRELLGDLQSISTLLDVPPMNTPLKQPDIPVLNDIVDVPDLERPREAALQNDSARAAASIVSRDELRDVLEIEAVRIVDELMDEYLPQIEARLRERLEARQRELVRATLRQHQRGI